MGTALFLFPFVKLVIKEDKWEKNGCPTKSVDLFIPFFLVW
jgi:hypothetical protein